MRNLRLQRFVRLGLTAGCLQHDGEIGQSIPFVNFLLHHGKRRLRLALHQQRLAKVPASPQEVRR